MNTTTRTPHTGDVFYHGWAFNSYLFSIFSYLIMIFSFRCMVYWNTWDY